LSGRRQIATPYCGKRSPFHEQRNNSLHDSFWRQNPAKRLECVRLQPALTTALGRSEGNTARRGAVARCWGEPWHERRLGSPHSRRFAKFGRHSERVPVQCGDSARPDRIACIGGTEPRASVWSAAPAGAAHVKGSLKEAPVRRAAVVMRRDCAGAGVSAGWCRAHSRRFAKFGRHSERVPVQCGDSARPDRIACIGGTELAPASGVRRRRRRSCERLAQGSARAPRRRCDAQGLRRCRRERRLVPAHSRRSKGQRGLTSAATTVPGEPPVAERRDQVAAGVPVSCWRRSACS